MSLANVLPIPEAAAKYGLDVKRLRGYVWRNDLHDPIGCAKIDRVYDDWRFAAPCGALTGSHGVMSEILAVVILIAIAFAIGSAMGWAWVRLRKEPLRKVKAIWVGANGGWVKVWPASDTD